MKKLPILIALPHASLRIPIEVRKQILLSRNEIMREKWDTFTAKIFEIPNAHILKATYSRIVVDLNRAPDDCELDEKGFCKNGVVVSKQENGKITFRDTPTKTEIARRVKKYHQPFHAKIKKKFHKSNF